MRIKRECFNLEVTGSDKQRNGEGSYSAADKGTHCEAALYRTVRGELELPDALSYGPSRD